MPRTTRRSSCARALLVVGAITLLAAGCGDDTGSTDTGPTDPGETDPGPTDTGETDTGTDAAGDSEPADRGAELVGDWTITTFQMAGGVGEAEPAGDDPVTISFADDGTFTFSTGCNTGDGEWEAWGVYYAPTDEDDAIPEGQGIEFDGISRTEADCDDETAEQDLAIGGAIRAATRFTVDDSSFTLLRDGNVMLAGTAG
ncbi:MAG: META domain-containing protein [Acidimicrobiales bacterium]